MVEKQNSATAEADGPIEPVVEPSADASADEANARPVDGANEPAELDPATRSDAQPKPRARGQRQSRVSSLYRALRSGRPLEGTVERVIKGGYEIKLGKIRGFCPHSQLDLHRVDRPEGHVGRSYYFRVTQVRRGGEDVVVSRRAVLEEERADEASAVRATLLEGAVMQGRVAGMADFGAFVDLGAGVMGLVHVSELSHSRVARVRDAVKEGDQVRVKILKLHAGGKKISLSIRQAEHDPWGDVAAKFRPGQTHPGVVRRITQFGAFVELEPGVEALAPASEFPPSPQGWKEGLEVGRLLDWLVLSVDGRHRRISLTTPVHGFDAEKMRPLEIGAMLSGRVQRVEDYGVFVWLGPGRVGLMPNALSGAPRGTDMRKRFRPGEEIEVEVRELEDDGRRIRLAKKGVSDVAERPPRRQRKPAADAPAPRRPPTSPEPTSFGTSLADKLREALGESAK